MSIPDEDQIATEPADLVPSDYRRGVEFAADVAIANGRATVLTGMTSDGLFRVCDEVTCCGPTAGVVIVVPDILLITLVANGAVITARRVTLARADGREVTVWAGRTP